MYQQAVEGNLTSSGTDDAVLGERGAAIAISCCCVRFTRLPRPLLNRSERERKMDGELLHGTLYVWIYEARNLPNTDEEGFIGGIWRKLRGETSSDKTDAYASVELPPAAVVARTRVINDSLNPSWDESFVIKVAHKTTDVLIYVKDNDVIDAPRIGTCRIPVSSLPDGVEIESWFPLYIGDLATEARIRLKLMFESIDTLKLKYGRFGQLDRHMGVPHTFFRERAGNRVTLFQDAHVADSFAPRIYLENRRLYKQHHLWEEIYTSILEAKHFIYICGWSVNHKTVLVRDESRMIQGARDVTLGELLKRKADEGVKVLLLVWDDRTSGVLGRQTGIMGTHDQETFEFFKGTNVTCALSGRDPDKALTAVESIQIGMMFTHHQKLVALDVPLRKDIPRQRRVVAYVGGIDLCDGRYDDQSHSLFRTLATTHREDFHQPNFKPAASIQCGGPREPWHDIHARVEGPSAWDILYNFEQRWRKQRSNELHELYNLVENQALFQSPNSKLLADEDPEQWHVQFFRSIDTGSVVGFPDDPNKACAQGLVSGKDVTVERSIQDAYVHTIRKAEKFLYIENQYFLGSCFAWQSDRTVSAIHTIPVEIALKICSKIDAGEKFAVYIVIPMWPEGVPTDGSVQEILKWQHNTMEMMYKKIAQAIAKNNLHSKPTDFLNFYCLANRETDNGDEYRPSDSSIESDHYRNANRSRRFMIYVHSKMLIADDEYIIVGSANINQRSMDGGRDTESAIGAYQPYYTRGYREALPKGQIHGFRMSLWAEHTGVAEDVFFEPSRLRCVNRVNEIAHRNWEAFVADRPTDMPSHLMPYPVAVADNGAVLELPGCTFFPDSAACILGAKQALPDILTT